MTDDVEERLTTIQGMVEGSSGSAIFHDISWADLTPEVQKAVASVANVESLMVFIAEFDHGVIVSWIPRDPRARVAWPLN